MIISITHLSADYSFLYVLFPRNPNDILRMFAFSYQQSKSIATYSNMKQRKAANSYISECLDSWLKKIKWWSNSFLIHF